MVKAVILVTSCLVIISLIAVLFFDEKLMTYVFVVVELLAIDAKLVLSVAYLSWTFIVT